MKHRSILPVVATLLLAGCLGASNGVITPFGTTGASSPTITLTKTGATSFSFAVGNPSSGATYTWYFGDLSDPVTGTSAQHSYDVTEGMFPVTVVETQGAAVSYGGATATVGDGHNNEPIAQFNLTTTDIKTGSTIPVDGKGTHDPDGDSLSVEWVLVTPPQANSMAGMDMGGMPMVASSAGSDGGASGGLLGHSEDHGGGTGGSSGSMAGMNMSGVNMADYPDVILPASQTVSIAYPDAGLYQYHCHPHPWMIGEVIADPAAASATATVVVVNYSFIPPIVHVKPGGKVLFRNLDGVEHEMMHMAFLPAGQVLPLTTASGQLSFSQAGSYNLYEAVWDGKHHVQTAMMPITVEDNPTGPVKQYHFNGTFGSPVSVLGGMALQNAPQNSSFSVDYPGVLYANSTAGGTPSYGHLRFQIFDGAGKALFRGNQIEGLVSPGPYTLVVDTNDTVVAHVQWSTNITLTQMMGATSMMGPSDDHGF